MKVGYLGPAGTYSEQAGLSFLRTGDEGVLYSTIYDLLYAAHNGQIDKAVAPIENSLQGTVAETLDTLIFDVDLFIQSEYLLSISHKLLSKEKKDSYKKIISHPQAIGQCRNFLNTRFKNTEIILANSTAEAAKMAAEAGPDVCAIAAPFCSSLYDLTIVAEDIADRKTNITRFVELAKHDTQKPFPNCKTSIAFSTMNKPGELYKILDIFSLWGINMTKIESRPMKNNLGEYVFFIDALGVSDYKDIEDALTMIKRKTVFFKSMGCYANR